MKSIPEHTTCIVVGGGPAGAVLSYMLARRDVPVILLEAHHDFDRDYRGDTLHPSILEIMDELGLAERLLLLPHTKLQRLTGQTPAGPIEMGDFTHLKTKFPYIAIMRQTRFLEFITNEARRFPSFRLVMGARVEELIEKDGQVEGVRYHAADGVHETRAQLVVGADGRYSMLRKLGGFQAVSASPSIDMLWFRLPREPADVQGLMGRFSNGHVLIQLDRDDQWQCGLSIPKGSFPQLRAAGLEALRETIIGTAPEYAGRVAALTDWKKISLLSIEADYVTRWYKPGLLLIGDAAHVMSPVGGNGINYAIQDAVVTANLLSEPLRVGHVSVDDLAKVQKRRARPIRIIQAAVSLVLRILPLALAANKRMTASSAGGSSFSINLFRHVLALARPFVNAVLVPAIAFGISPVHVEDGSE